MEGAVPVTVPGGRWVDGVRRQEVRLRPLVGWDEDALLATGAGRGGATWATELLCRCAIDVGGEATAPEAVRDLCVGDREALLWHVRRITAGDELDAVVECPACSQKLELRMSVADLLQPSYSNWAESFTEELGGHEVVFRLPTGGDLERVAGDPDRGAAELLSACVVSVDGGEAPPLDGLADLLSVRLADLDPQAEALLVMSCTECGHQLSAPLDAASYLWEEMSHRSEQLYREVHALAWYYHWSEPEILAMTALRRARYLELIDDSLRPGGGP